MRTVCARCEDGVKTEGTTGTVRHTDTDRGGSVWVWGAWWFNIWPRIRSSTCARGFELYCIALHCILLYRTTLGEHAWLWSVSVLYYTIRLVLRVPERQRVPPRTSALSAGVLPSCSVWFLNIQQNTKQYKKYNTRTTKSAPVHIRSLSFRRAP